MPTLAVIFGITITMNFEDHPPPHFHARYAEKNATYLLDGNPHQGSLGRKQDEQIRDWATKNADALKRAWDDCADRRNPGKID